ncbi:hypothetical protein KC929_00570 [Patescibacteria group bacterium]|nr:hypothetical protein [Patescibacteria group bacterium]
MKNITFPEKFKKPIVEAISRYPELQHKRISFKLVKSRLPYYARPAVISLLNPFAHRSYIIGISEQSTIQREPTLLKNLPYEAQVGAMVHELAHILYYTKKTSLGILADGLLYFFPRYREYFEKMTDRIAIEKGLGNYILAWSEVVYEVKKNDGRRGKIYYSPTEIRKLL